MTTQTGQSKAHQKLKLRGLLCPVHLKPAYVISKGRGHHAPAVLGCDDCKREVPTS